MPVLRGRIRALASERQLSRRLPRIARGNGFKLEVSRVLSRHFLAVSQLLAFVALFLVKRALVPLQLMLTFGANGIRHDLASERLLLILFAKLKRGTFLLLARLQQLPLRGLALG